MNVLVLGDSIPWGQGHLLGNKFAVEVARRLATGATVPRVINYSHSGAHIGAPADAPAPGRISLDAVQGEIPRGTPSIHGQLSRAKRDAGLDGSSFDVVILNGGINDEYDGKTILGGWIANPFAETRELHALAEESCHRGMRGLLERAIEAFPRSVVIVTGYYPIISRASTLSLCTVYTTGLSHSGPDDVGKLGRGLRVRLANRSKAWSEASSQSLQRAVDESQPHLEPPGKLVLAKVDFSERNCLFAPESWLWGIREAEFELPVKNLTLKDAVEILKSLGAELVERLHGFEPEDPLFQQRRSSCDAKLNCPWASVGHPNEAGTARFVDSIQRAFDRARSS